MRGNGGVESLEDYLKNPVETAKMITFFVSAIVLHMIGIKFGIFPKLFLPLSALTNSYFLFLFTFVLLAGYIEIEYFNREVKGGT